MPKVDNWSAALDLTYDAWNRLVKVVDGGNTVAEYAYDGQNRRSLKKTYVNGGLDKTRHYYYSHEWQILEERVDTGTSADRQFVWGLRYDDDLILRDRGTERLYALHDAFHVTTLIDTAGAAQERFGYDAFGTSRVMDASFASRSASNYDWETRYGAYRWDAESGLYQVRHRYYQPKLGRWTVRDEMQYRDSQNLYAYVRDNPVNFVDPLGLQVSPTNDECLSKIGSCSPLCRSVWTCDAPANTTWHGIIRLPGVWLYEAECSFICTLDSFSGLGCPPEWQTGVTTMTLNYPFRMYVWQNLMGTSDLSRFEGTTFNCPDDKCLIYNL